LFPLQSLRQTTNTMGRVSVATVLALSSLQNAAAFLPSSAGRRAPLVRLKAEGDGAMSWQEAAEKALNPFTGMNERQIMLQDLFARRDEVIQDVSDAVSSGDPQKLATEGSTLRRAITGLEALQRQVTDDILPELVEEGPSLAMALLSGALAQIPKTAATAAETFSDPSRALQGLPDLASLPKLLSDEALNVISEVPVGLEQPPYAVVMKGDGFEVRDYEALALATTGIAARKESASGMYTGGTFEDVGGGGSSEGEGGEVDSEFGSAPPAPDDATWTIDSIIGGGVPQPEALMMGQGFQRIAGYIFGKNDKSQTLAMTTPVVTSYEGGAALRMSFVLPRTLAEDGAEGGAEGGDGAADAAASSAPVPLDARVAISAKPKQRVAVKEFQGIATPGEVKRQLQALKEALYRSGMTPKLANSGDDCYQVYQYNPPTTLPFLRKNELCIRLEVGPEPTEAETAGLEGGSSLEEDDDGVIYCESDEECGLPSD